MYPMHRLAAVFLLLATAFVPPAFGNTVTGVTVTPPAAEAGATVTATVTGAAGYCGAVHLDWGDGTAVTHATEHLPVTQTHVYRAGGTFTVTARGMGNCTGEASAQVSIKGPPVVSELKAVEVSPTTAMIGTAVRITLHGTGSCRMTLNFGDGRSEQLERGLPASVPHTYQQPGGYTVSAVPEASCGGGQRTAALEVTPKEGPARLTGLEVGAPRQGSAAVRSITVGGSGSCRYTIDYGDGNSESRTRQLPDTVQHTYGTAGRYEVVATAVPPCSGAARSTITIGQEAGGRDQRGQVSRIDVRPQVLRPGEAVAIAVAGTGTCRLVLDFDDGDSRTVTTPLPYRTTHRYRGAGDYEIVVWTDEPCSGVGEAMVRVR